MTRLPINGVTYNVVYTPNFEPESPSTAHGRGERGKGIPLILLHGFLGSAESWHDHWQEPTPLTPLPKKEGGTGGEAVLNPVSMGEGGIREADALTLLPSREGRTGEKEILTPLPSQGRGGGLGSLIAIDALGHGKSDAQDDPARYAMPHVVADTLTIMDTLGVEKFALLGYSMGGRMALHIAAAAPLRVTALMLESSTPGLATAEGRAVRVVSDEELARFIETHPMETFLDRWEKLPLFATQRDLPDAVRTRQRAQRLANNPHGLANSLRGAGTGVQESLWDRLPDLTMPVLLIAGERDPKFSDIARQMHALLPHSHLEIVSGAGHSIHLEEPHYFDRLVRDFLQPA